MSTNQKNQPPQSPRLDKFVWKEGDIIILKEGKEEKEEMEENTDEWKDLKAVKEKREGRKVL